MLILKAAAIKLLIGEFTMLPDNDFDRTNIFCV